MFISVLVQYTGPSGKSLTYFFPLVFYNDVSIARRMVVLDMFSCFPVSTCLEFSRAIFYGKGIRKFPQ